MRPGTLKPVRLITETATAGENFDEQLHATWQQVPRRSMLADTRFPGGCSTPEHNTFNILRIDGNHQAGNMIDQWSAFQAIPDNGRTEEVSA